MRYNMGDSWDGFDTKQYVYDEKKEKKWRTSIWKVSFCLMALIIIYLFTDHIREIRLVQKGTMIEAEYDSEKCIARYWDDDGLLHTYDLSSYFPAHEDGIVCMYYIDSVNYAVPRNTLSSRLFCYFLFGGLLALCVWRIKKNS